MPIYPMVPFVSVTQVQDLEKQNNQPMKTGLLANHQSDNDWVVDAYVPQWSTFFTWVNVLCSHFPSILFQGDDFHKPAL